MPNTQHKPLMRRPLPSDVFTRALDSLRQDAFAPTAVLKGVLELGAAPENMPQIATDSIIVPTCMRLLQKHCAHFRIFGENDYVITCIRIITLRVQVNFLESIGCSFDDNGDTGYDGPTSSLRTLEDALSNAIAAGYQNRRPSDPPDLFRTSVGLVHVPLVLTSDQAGRLLDYLHRERDLFLRARVSGTSDWAGWPFLFHALWERLVFRNNNKMTRLALKLLDICYRFIIAISDDASESVLLKHLVPKIRSETVLKDNLPAAVNSSDKQQIIRAYISRFTNASPDFPTMELSHALFGWTAFVLDPNQRNLVVEFITTSYEHLWVVIEDTKNRKRTGYFHIVHVI
ncbi:hypothetical protein FRC09_013118 [Ceratobasidium sp. 395]|nr:hypothetical protein FRC09_013118 [Ceratobasidium sp. 395]